MLFSTIKHKIKEEFEKIQRNFHKITEKINKDTSLNNNISTVIPSRVLYDSGWFAESQYEGNTTINYLYISNINDPVANENTLTPIIINYNLETDIEIPKNLIPFIKWNVFIKKRQDVQISNYFRHNYIRRTTDPYYKITGDSTIIYQGYFATRTQFSQSQLNNGEFSEDNTGKWFRGQISYTDGINNVTIDGLIDEMLVSDQSFYGRAFFQFNNSYFTGKEVNGVTRKINYASSDYKMFFIEAIKKINGVVQPGSSFNVNSADVTINSLIITDNNTYKLFYSNNLITRLKVDAINQILYLMPNKTEYPSETLPYTHLNLKTNKDIDEEILRIQRDYIGNEVHTWVKVNKLNSDEHVYRLIINGLSLGILPATEKIINNITIIDETYSPSGDSYSRDAENRSTEQLIRYRPKLHDIELKYQLSITSPHVISTIKSIKKEELF